ncbi:hypothetical protein, partial [Enterococcus faecalis]|uniref:hypothetical protein n=2 Tax=Enterococcus faecalis TaxID=1351 RepID=UPI0027E13AC6
IIIQEKKEHTNISKSVDIVLKAFQENYFTLSSNTVKQIEPFLYSTHTVVSLFKNLTTDLNGYHYLRKINIYFPELKKRLENFIKYLYTMSNNKIFLEENYLIIYYWMLFSHFNKAYMFELETNILLETDVPQVLWAPLSQIIKEHFDSKYNIKVYTGDMNFEVDKIHIVLSTNTVEGIDQDYSNAQIIAINREINSRDLNKIEEVLLYRLGSLTNNIDEETE